MKKLFCALLLTFFISLVSTAGAQEAKPQWGPYMAKIEKDIKKFWLPPKGEESKRVVVYFKIGKEGELITSKVTKSSGIKAADDAALRAVRSAQPFAPLPKEYKDQSIDIDFTFDYNVVRPGYKPVSDLKPTDVEKTRPVSSLKPIKSFQGAF